MKYTANKTKSPTNIEKSDSHTRSGDRLSFQNHTIVCFSWSNPFKKYKFTYITYIGIKGNFNSQLTITIGILISFIGAETFDTAGGEVSAAVWLRLLCGARDDDKRARLIMLNVDLVVGDLISHGRHPRKVLAEILDIDQSYLSRMAQPSWNVHHVDVPFRKMLIIGQEQDPVKFGRFAAACMGGYFMKAPRVAINKDGQDDAVMVYQEMFSEAVRALMNYFRQDSEENRGALMTALDRVVELSLGLRKLAVKRASRQTELFDRISCDNRKLAKMKV